MPGPVNILLSKGALGVQSITEAMDRLDYIRAHGDLEGTTNYAGRKAWEALEEARTRMLVLMAHLSEERRAEVRE